MRNAAVAFVSALAVELAPDRLSALMADAARFNEAVGGIGVTLFDGSRFLSYMEGPVDGLSAAFPRATGATTPSDTVLLGRRYAGVRRFASSPMQCLMVAADELLLVARSDWNSFVQRMGGTTAAVTAMEHLAVLVELCQHACPPGGPRRAR